MGPPGPRGAWCQAQGCHLKSQQQQCWQQQRQQKGLCYLGRLLWGGRRPSRRAAANASLSSKVIAAASASAASAASAGSAAANIAAAEAFAAAAADFSDGNLGPDTNPLGPNLARTRSPGLRLSRHRHMKAPPLRNVPAASAPPFGPPGGPRAKKRALGPPGPNSRLVDPDGDCGSGNG